MLQVSLVALSLGTSGFVAIGSMRLSGIKVDCNSCVMVSFGMLMISLLALVFSLPMAAAA